MNKEKLNKIVKNILDIISDNKDITLISELLLEISDLKKFFFEYHLDKNNDIIEALNKNKIMIKRALKLKLYRANTTTSLIELNRILDNENNNGKINNFIDNLVNKWRS